MVSPVSAAYSQLERSRSPYLGHMAPSLNFPGLTLQANPDYAYNWPLWLTLRDCYAGEAAIKAAGQTYLRKLSAHKDSEYEGFLSRAYFYNAVRRTHDGLMASLHRKPPEFTLPPAARQLDLTDVTLDGQSIQEFAKTLTSEVTLMGRYGVLVDLPNTDGDASRADTDRPYLSGYCAENIYGWREVMHRGRRVVDRVILRETETVLDEYGTVVTPVVRILRLDPDPDSQSGLTYSQEIVRPHPAPDQPPSVETIPVSIRGRTLGYIPFVFVNAKNLLPGCGAPPLLDVATINISHYQSTALLEHGRFYAGMPTYVVSAGTEGSPETDQTPLAVGPSNVWELETGAKAWILEFNGHGLSFLENAVDSKQLQMQSLGGKLISSQRKAAALSSEAYSLMEAGDEATLLDVALQSERALQRALSMLCDFSAIDIPASNRSSVDGTPSTNGIVVEMNKEFVRSDLTARELRAIQALYTGGLIPLDVLYYALRSVQIIPIEYTLEDFRAMMEDKSQLYPDATGEVARREANRVKIEAARISAHVDEPALQPVPAPGHEDDAVNAALLASNGNNPFAPRSGGGSNPSAPVPSNNPPSGSS